MSHPVVPVLPAVPACCAAPPVLVGLAPVVSAQTVVLVLGSFPGAASLRAQQYYAHPHNQFWPLLARLWPQHPQPGPHDYAGRCQWLLERGLGLWDVYARCERQGSLDSRIRNAVVNDFESLVLQCPRLAAVAHNGAESHRHARQVSDVLAVPGVRLPSTSPAHAAWSLERKCAAWADLMSAHGLL